MARASESDAFSSAEDLIEEIDFSSVEEYFADIYPLFSNSSSLKDILKNLSNGKTQDANMFVSYFFSVFFQNLKSQIPTFISLLALLLLSGLIVVIEKNREEKSNPVARIIIFVCIVGSVAVAATATAEKARTALNKMSTITQSSFPILLALSASAGAEQTAAFISPISLFISETVLSVVDKFFFPIVFIMLSSAAVSKFDESLKLQKLFDFFASFLKWSIGLFAAIFSIFLKTNVVTANAFDSVRYKTAKYAVGSMVPIVGGIVKDGFDMIISSIGIVKNAFGVAVSALVFAAAAVPILEIIATSLILKFIAAVSEPFADGKAIGFISSATTVLNFIVAILVIVSFLYLSSFVSLINSAGYVFS